MHNSWFNRTEFILIDESECSVCMNAKNKVIGLMCAFICHKIQIGIYVFLTCIHCTNIVSHCLHIITTLLFLYLFLTAELIFFHFSIGFQSYRVFTCTLNRIRKWINHPLRSDRAQSDRLRCLHEAFSARLSRQSDYKRIICLHVNVANELVGLARVEWETQKVWNYVRMKNRSYGREKQWIFSVHLMLT